MPLSRTIRLTCAAVLLAATVMAAACSEKPYRRLDPPADALVSEPSAVYLRVDGKATAIPASSVYHHRLWRIVDSAVRADRGGTVEEPALADEPLRAPILEPLPSGTASGGGDPDAVMVALWYPSQTDVYVASDTLWSGQVDGRGFGPAMASYGLPAMRRYDGTVYRVKEIQLNAPLTEKAGEVRLVYVLTNRAAPASDPYRLFRGYSVRTVDVTVYDPADELRELVRRFRAEPTK